MIREDRELLAELAQLNTAMAPLAIRIIDGTASAAEQHDYARRLITAGEWLQRRAARLGATVIDGEVITAIPLTVAGTPWSLTGSRDQCVGNTLSVAPGAA